MPLPLPRLPGRIIRRLVRRPLVVVSAASLAIRMGRDAYRVKQGEMDGAEFRARSGGHVGGVSGAALGATAGTIAGSIVPGIGSILGGLAGGMLGEIGGTKVGRSFVERAEERIGRSPKKSEDSGPEEAKPEDPKPEDPKPEGAKTDA